MGVLIGKARYAEEVTRRAAELDLFGILTNVQGEGGPRRQLLLFSARGDVAAQAASFAKAYTKVDFQLQEISLVGPTGVKAFNQLNVGASRKQVAPCLGEFFKSLL